MADLEETDLLKFVEFLAGEENPLLVPTTLEAVRHLPVIEDGPLFSVREHERANAMGRDVVIKVFKRSLSPGTPSKPTRAEFEQLLREVRILCSKPVALHNNLIDVESIEFGILTGDPFELCPALALERAQHGDLALFLKKNRSLTWQMKKDLCQDVANGLNCLHRHGILHGDLKMAHVLIFDHPQRQYVAKLTGFGDSHIIDTAMPASVPVIGGTKPFRAPEVEEGSTTFERLLKIDIFSVGLVFWSIFVNQTFFETFDLPLDSNFHENDIMDILKLPFLFRYIPLLIEHEIGLIEEMEFQMLLKLFACTVRLSPDTRDLSRALQLLGEQNEPLDEARISRAQGTVTSVDLKFDKIRVSVNALKSLPYSVARQYLDSLKLLLQSESTATSLRETAIWCQFLCNLYGCGTEQNARLATEILADCSREASEFADIANLLVPVLREALGSSSSTEGQQAETDAPTVKSDWSWRSGLWANLRQRPPVRPEEHGISIGIDDAVSSMSNIQEGESPMEARCGFSNTLLHVFAAFGKFEEVKRLVEENKADVNAINDRSETALLLACRYGNHEIAAYLLDHEADASIESTCGDSGLHWLCSIPSEKLGELALNLFRCGARLPVDAQPEEGADWTPITPGLDYLRDGKILGDPLLRAVANRDVVVVRLLLYLHGVIASTVDPRVQFVLIVQALERPLRLACELNLYDVIDVLCLEFKQIVEGLPEVAIPLPLLNLVGDLKRSDPTAIGQLVTAVTNLTAPRRAAIDMSFHVHRLCYHKHNWKLACRLTLHILAKYGFLKQMVNTDAGPYTVLAYAVRCGNDEALKCLLEIGDLKESIDVADNRRYTLVQHAIESRQFNILSTLVKNGATFDLRKKKDPYHCLSGVGASYLHVLGSIRCDDQRIIQLLLDQGIPANIRDDRGVSALSLALTRGAFTLARTLIDEGASILNEGVFGVTPLGDIFIPGQANQHDDFFSTFNFLVSYRERGVAVQYTRQLHKYTVFHTAAAYCSKDKLYPVMVDKLFQSFKAKSLIEAPANTPAKSTALQIAIAMYNPIMVKALVNGGVTLDGKDSAGRTPLDYAVELLYRLVHNIDGIVGAERIEKLDHICKIVLTLSQKAGWPKEIRRFPQLTARLDEADILLKKMMCSEHQVAFMRHLERAVLGLVAEGYAPMLCTMQLHHLDLVRRISMERIQPVLRMDLEFRVIPDDGSSKHEESFQRVKKDIPWCFSLTNNYLQDLQFAASFEWLLDLIQTKKLPEGQLKYMSEGIKDFALSGKKSDLKLDPEIVRYPYSLLQWYEKAISNDALVLQETDQIKIEGFVSALRARKEAQDRNVHPLPPFSEEFRDVHFNLLQPERLDPGKALATVQVVTRCRCFFDSIGLFSRFRMTRLCQRMTSIDDQLFSERLAKMRDDAAKGLDKLCEWKSKIGVPLTRKSPISIMKWIMVDEEFNRKESLLTHPEDVESDEATNARGMIRKPIPPVPVPKASSPSFPYKPLGQDKREIRLLRLLPAGLDAGGRVSCEIEHYSVAPEYYTQEYRDYEQPIDKTLVRPSDFHRDWQEENSAKRFVWGDFSCLSYTWGDPEELRVIALNGHEVKVRSNLEAALRSLRQRDEFQKGLLLWTDALCINQDDISEKERTIRYMQDIYLGANTVTLWLGAESSETEAAFRNIRDAVAKYSKVPEDSADLMHAEMLKTPPIWFSTIVYPAIVHLMDRPYWRRLWIMQEVTSCAPCENIYVGSHRIQWSELVLLLKLYMESRESTDFNDQYTEALNNRVLDNIKQAHVLAIMAELYRQLPGLGKWNTSVVHGNPASWMYLGGTAEVTDERDRVYGILGLIPERVSCLIEPNYTQSVEDAYRSLSRALIKATGSFDEVFGSDLIADSDFASWAADLRNTARSRPKHGRAGGFGNHYDDFLKTGQDYRLTVRKKPTPEDPHPDENDDSAHYAFSDDGRLLTILAVHVDTVEGVSGSVVRNAAPTVILEAPWKPSERPLNLREGTTARETILRVLTADTEFVDDGNGTLLDIPYYDELEPEPTLVEELHNNGWSNIVRSNRFRVFHKFRFRKAKFPLFEGKELETWFSRAVVPCDEEAMEKVLGWVSTVAERTFITTIKGNLGSTGVQVKEGDRIFVSPGCSYPFLVRFDGESHRVVGECYVDGYMLGEAMDMVDDGQLEMEKIQLR